MNRFSFPWVALVLGGIIAIVLQQVGVLDTGGEYALPLLTLLVVVEFGFFVTGIGAVLGARTLIGQGFAPLLLVVTLCCGLLSLGFLYLGFTLWPDGLSG
jgi:hypothetical protein